MIETLKHLKENIKVAVIGIGSMGRGLYYQCRVTPGIDCVALADININRLINYAEESKLNFRVVNNITELNKAIKDNILAITEDGELLTLADGVSVIIESSSSIIPGLKFSISALENHKHLILMNSEVDLAFGPPLLDLARRNGVVYTSCDGDQHGVIKHLVDEITLWGFELVMAGNIKGFLDRYSNPTKIIPEADIRNLDYKMATAYTDGTKLNIEMALVANCQGLITSTPGMNGPKTGNVKDVFKLFDFYSIFENKIPVVDYILGAEPGGGVYVVGYNNNPYQKSMLKYYKMGDGPFYLFYRPYHLCHIEAINTIVNAYLYHEPLLEPVYGYKTNVYTYAKRDLKKGEILDGLGGYTCYGMIENNHMENYKSLPVCLSDNVVLLRDIAKDSKILISDISYDPERLDFSIFNNSSNLIKI